MMMMIAISEDDDDNDGDSAMGDKVDNDGAPARRAMAQWDTTTMTTMAAA